MTSLCVTNWPPVATCRQILVAADSEHRTLEAAKASRLAAMNASARAEFDEASATEQRRLDDADGSSEVDAPD
jgi:hypothetical protein